MVPTGFWYDLDQLETGFGIPGGVAPFTIASLEPKWVLSKISDKLDPMVESLGGGT